MSALTPDGWDDLIQKIERQLVNLDPLGPRLDDGKVFERAEGMLFRDGRRVAVSEGHQINWRSYRTLRAELRALLLPVVDGSNLAAQLAEMYRVAEQSPHDLERVYYQDRGWRLIEPDWLRTMMNDLKRIDALISEARVRALQEGRVILLGEGGQLIPPARARTVTPRDIELFLFSKDLPSAGLKSAGQKNGDIKRAGDIFVFVANHFRGEGRRVTKEQLLEIADQKLKLTRGAAERAYDRVKDTLKMKSGKPRDAEKVYYKEINDLLIRVEGK